MVSWVNFGGFIWVFRWIRCPIAFHAGRLDDILSRIIVMDLRVRCIFSGYLVRSPPIYIPSYSHLPPSYKNVQYTKFGTRTLYLPFYLPAPRILHKRPENGDSEKMGDGSIHMWHLNVCLSILGLLGGRLGASREVGSSGVGRLGKLESERDLKCYPEIPFRSAVF